jgi:uncharacterized protein (DUF58 family)
MMQADVATLIDEGTRAAIPYDIYWRIAAPRPGAHRGQQLGIGGAFRGVAPLIEFPDPRRIDVRMTARDPFGTLYVRRFEQRSAATVYVLADVSGSMAFAGRSSKLRLLALISAALAISAHQYGDQFGFIGCDEAIRDELFFPASRKRGLEIEVARRLLALVPAGQSAEGLIEAAARLSGRRKLVFLISDFHMPLSVVEAALANLARHDVVPIMLGDSLETAELPRWGLVELRDLETGRKRLAVMRPSLGERWRRRARDRDAALDRLCSRYARPLTRVTDRLDVHTLWQALAGR